MLRDEFQISEETLIEMKKERDDARSQAMRFKEETESLGEIMAQRPSDQGDIPVAATIGIEHKVLVGRAWLHRFGHEFRLLVGRLFYGSLVPAHDSESIEDSIRSGLRRSFLQIRQRF